MHLRVPLVLKKGVRFAALAAPNLGCIKYIRAIKSLQLLYFTLSFIIVLLLQFLFTVLVLSIIWGGKMTVYLLYFVFHLFFMMSCNPLGKQSLL